MPTEPRWTRRRFLHAAGLAAGASLLRPPSLRAFASAPGAAPLTTLRLGLLSSADVRASASAAAGVALGVKEAARTAALFGRDVRLLPAASVEASVPDRARRLVDDGADVLLSALSDADTAALADAADSLRVPLLNLTASGDALRGAACRRFAFHVAPSRAMRVDAAARWLATVRNAKQVFLVVADGPEWEAAAARLTRALAALGSPPAGRTGIDTDNGGSAKVRGRLPHGVDAVVVLADADALGSLASRWLEWSPLAAPMLHLDEVPADALGDRGSAAATLHSVHVASWVGTLERFGADQLNQRFRQASGRAMDEAAWAGWVAVKAAWDAAARGQAQDAAGIAAYLSSDRAEIDGQKGWPLSFRPWDHQLRQPMYVVGRGSAGGGLEGELPGVERGEGASSAAALDALGESAAETACRWGSR
ncbi:MAG: hypothetical protein JWM27_248 [Gemmatimonadetes bacterium]|nr:hypothetical protein [Gemmatimonadota bacterium]